MQAANIAMGELSEQVGTALMPAMTTFASVMTTYVLPAITALLDNKVALIALGIVIGSLFLAWAAGAVAAAAATLLPIAPFIAIGVAAAAVLIVANWDKIKGAAMAVFNWLKNNWPLLLAIITGPIGLAVLAVQRNWDTIKAGATAVWQWVTDKWNAIGSAIGGIIGTITGYINTIVTQIKRPIAAATEVWRWVSDKFNALAGAIAGVVGGITNSVRKIVDAIKLPINTLLRGWNAISFTIPRISIPKIHIPGTNKDIGGGSFGGQSFGTPNIPLLAGGGVLTSPTLFIGGEAGREIVTPESLLRQILSEEGHGASYTLNIYPRQVDPSDLAAGFRRLELMSGHRG
jgi:MFS family permease